MYLFLAKPLKNTFMTVSHSSAKNPFSKLWESLGTPSRNSGASPKRFERLSSFKTDKAPDILHQENTA